MLTQVLIVGRSGAAVQNLKTFLQGAAGLDVRGHVITNGHVDPLEGIDFMPEMVLLHFEAKRTAELSAWAARPAEGRPIPCIRWRSCRGSCLWRTSLCSPVRWCRKRAA